MSILNKPLPQDVEAEEAVIAALMVDDEVYGKIVGMVEPDDFYHRENGWCFEAAMALGSRLETINQITVAHELGRKLEDTQRTRLDLTGGQSYLAETIRKLPTSIGVEYYARAVREAAVKRRMLTSLTTLAEAVYRPQFTAEELIGQALETIMSLSNDGANPKDVRSFAQLLDGGLFESVLAMTEANHRSDRFIESGLKPLDALITGFFKGGLITVAAPTSIGKSLFVQDRAISVAQRGHRVLMFTTEMAAEDVAQRQLFMLAEKDELMIRRRAMLNVEPDAQDMHALQQAIDEAHRLPIEFEDINNVSIERIVATVHRKMAQKPYDLIIVDHFHELSTDEKFNSDESRYSHIASKLQGLAAHFKIPLVCVVQQNRTGNEGNINATIKGTSALEQKATVTLFLNPIDHRLETLLTPDMARERAGDPGWTRVRLTAAKVRKGGTTGSKDLVVDFRKGGRWYSWPQWAADNPREVANG